MKRIGFDFDQTLADSSQGIYDCLQSICQDLFIDFSPLDLRRLSVSGLSLEETLISIVPVAKMEIATSMFMERYPTIGINGTKIFNGVNELFQDLRKAKVEIIVLSAKSVRNLKLSLDHLDLKVDQAVGNLNYEGKVENIRKFNLEYYVGDQLTDVQAATEAGCLGILINDSAGNWKLAPRQIRFQSIEHFRKSLNIT